MTFLKTVVLGFALSISTAHAQELSDEERTAMIDRVDAFSESMAEGDMGAVFDYMPPEVLALLVEQSGQDEETLIEMSKAQIEMAMATVTVDDFAMDIEAATYQMTPDGSRAYLLIPTQTMMTIEGSGTVIASSETLAFEDEGEWYLARVDEPAQAALIQTAYPEFVGVEFAPGTIEAAE
jgi:hypothetical protein